MKSVSSLVAFAATIILHLGLIAIVALGLPGSEKKTALQEPMEVKLLHQQPPMPKAQPPVAPPLPPALSAAPARFETKPSEVKPRTSPRPEATRREATTAQTRPAEPVSESKVPSKAPATPSISPLTSPPPANSQPQAAQPTRTSATEATYASTNRKPPYPRLSRSNEEEGTVTLRVLVKADGTAGTVEIKNSSGYPLLDESARSTVQTWRFSPATVDGKPVAEWYQLAIPFTLQNN